MGAHIAQLLDSGRTRDAAYAIVVAVMFVQFARERRRLDDVHRTAGASDALWPRYWAITAVLLIAMLLGRAWLADAVTEFGREQARERDWYDLRRRFQIVAVVAVVASWSVGTLVAVVRFPPRRRRYLPNLVVTSTLVTLAGLRLVSLHQVDTVLYRTHVGGVRIIAPLELALLALAAATTLRVDVVHDRPRPADDTAPA